ncbi:MAG: hypothetical protein PF638_12910 [Candidatus Delongbacteria bacterium]|jgi:hypothetical protein|nr:hypothetical protein [Candidatus Delongbacteria bacterium]
MHKFTNLSEDEIQSYLDKIKRIAKMDTKDALIEVDEFIYNLAQRGIIDSKNSTKRNENEDDDMYEINDEEYTIEEFIEEFEKDIKEARKSVKKNSIDDYWSIEALKNKIEVLNDLKENNTYESSHVIMTKGQKLRTTAEELIVKLEYLRYSEVIQKSLIREIFTLSSIKSIIYEVNEAESILIKCNKLTDELKEVIYKSKERCCKFRAMKKINDAIIAEKIGNDKKAMKLRLEAQAIFEQDWINIFKNQDFYQIEE